MPSKGWLTLLPGSPVFSREKARRPGRGRLSTGGGVPLSAAFILSVVLHMGLAGAVVWLRAARPAPSPPDEPGQIEMVMVQQRGSVDSPAASPTPAAAATVQPKQPSPPPASQSTSKQPEPAKPAPAPSTDDPSKDASGAPATAEAKARLAPAAPSPSPAAVPAAPKAPVFDLTGTEDEFTAIASGQGIIPASPDSRYRNNPPIYPREAAIRGEQGAVVLLIHVSDTGVPTGADVVETSGVASLDDAALTAVRRWHFHPAIKDGRAVPFDVPFRFVFEGG